MKIICYVATTFKVSPLGFGCPALVTITDCESAAVTAQHFIWDMLLVKKSFTCSHASTSSVKSTDVELSENCAAVHTRSRCFSADCVKTTENKSRCWIILNLLSFSLAPCKHFSGALTHCSGKNEPRSRLHTVEHPHFSQQCCNCRATHISSCRGPTSV